MKAVLTYDLRIVGEAVIDPSDLERDDPFDIIFIPDTSVMLECGGPFCHRGQRPLSVLATRWAVRFEP